MMCERFTACSLFQHEKVDDARSHDDADKESNGEGVSLLQSFRTQFSQVLNQANMAQLLKDMQAKAQGKKIS